jgi:zinc protease
MTDDLIRKQLPNGLTVLLKEIHTAPIISSWVWYRVGSRDEVPGITGISHWVEHMQFKGTQQFPAGVLDKSISRDGGVWNAFTHLDWTTFYETMPADKIDLALRLEADRMTNSIYDPEEVASERTVIISEREGSENEPLFQLGEAIQAAAFRVHPYHHQIIGNMPDLLNMQRDDLFKHYRTYYTPSNALLAVAGDFEVEEMLSKIDEQFGSLPGGVRPCYKVITEPPATGEHVLTVEGNGETTYIQLAYRAPSASDTEFFKLSVLDSLLTGPTGLNMFGGGGISNKTSRLYRALVEKELAVSVSGGLQATIDQYLYDITVILNPKHTTAEVISAIDQEIHNLQDTVVPEDEVARAIKQARALFIYGSENITNQAFWMGYSEMFDSYDWFIHYVDKLAEVTPEDVQLAARQYLCEKNRILGVYRPGQNRRS